MVGGGGGGGGSEGGGEASEGEDWDALVFTVYWREKERGREREREVYMINEWRKKYWLPS